MSKCKAHVTLISLISKLPEIFFLRASNNPDLIYPFLYAMKLIYVQNVNKTMKE